jgi:hypothetical protein
MTEIPKIGSIDWAMASVAIGVLLVVVCLVCFMLLRDSRKKQKFYKRFGNNVNEGIVVLSQNLDYLYSMPLFAEEPLLEKLVQGQSLQELLDPKDWGRMRLFFEETEKHRDIPFLFSVKLEDRDILWYELRCFIYRASLSEYHYVCFLKNITREQETRRERQNLQDTLDLMLKTTGDFLWSLDVEKRLVTFLTPIVDEDFQILPRSAGGVELSKIMPEEDAALLDKLTNRYVLEYKADNSIIEKNKLYPPVKIRLFNKKGNVFWYNLRGLIAFDEEGNLVFRGVANRLDLMMDNFVFDPDHNENALFSAALSLPDLRVFWVDREFKILGANQCFANAFHVDDLASIQGKPLSSVAFSKPLLYFNKVLTEVFETGRRVSWKSEGDELDCPMFFNVVPLKEKSGVALQALCAYIRLDFQNKEV